MPHYNSLRFSFLYASDHVIENISARLFGGFALHKFTDDIQALFSRVLLQLKELGFNTQNLPLGFIRGFTSIEEELFGLIHVTHIEKLAFGQSKLKIALHRSIERTKRLVAKLLFCFELCSNEPASRDRALALSLKKPWRVAQKWHSVSLRDTLAPAVSGKSENWRCFLDEVRTMYEQNPQDFDD